MVLRFVAGPVQDFASAQAYCSNLGMGLASVDTPEGFAKAYKFYCESRSVKIRFRYFGYSALQSKFFFFSLRL